MISKFVLSVFSLFSCNVLFSQYTLNGNATQDNCHCYTLTKDDFGKSGSVWNNNKINLHQSFDFKFDIFLGCADSLGADGIAFVMQPISTSVGSSGGGLGYSGVSPAVGVTVDTWQNGSPTTGDDGDPYFDHIAIQVNGDLRHSDSIAPFPINNLAGPVTALAGSDNIEDCQWHILRIQWDAPTKTLSAFVDGNLRVFAAKDFVTDIFSGDPQVFWGFTGSTGGAKNLQQFCTALNPVYRFLPAQNRCIGEPITFFDSTISFAPVFRRYWNFGDNTPVDSISVNPVHTYVAAGTYTITQTVIGADGCIETNTQQVLIGSKPVANFSFNNACMVDQVVSFKDSSTAAFGTINNWYWELGDSTTTSTQQNPSKNYNYPGFKTARLSVKSLEGCLSDTVSHIIQVYEKPIAGFSFTDNQWQGATVQFNGVSSVSDGTIDNWQWNMDLSDSAGVFTQNASHVYTVAGQHQVVFSTSSNHLCVSNPITKTISILPKPVAFFTQDTICQDVATLFSDSSYTTDGSNIIYWWWNLGNGLTSLSSNPVATYNTGGNFDVKLVVKAANNCFSDTLDKVIKIESKPLAKFGYNSPLCANRVIQFVDSSTISMGAIQSWAWSFDNIANSSLQNPSAAFTAGVHLVKLVVKNSMGCMSDTTSAVILINPKPAVSFTVSDACRNASVSFAGIDIPVGAVDKWKWEFGDGSTSPAKDTQHIYPAAGNYIVKLSGISTAGCFSDTVEKNITIYATNAFAGNDTIVAVNQPLQLQGAGGVFYEWTPATGLNNAHIANPVAINYADHSYILRAFSAFGCATYDTINIKVFDGPELYVPKAFTPNGDGLNDILKVLAVGTKQFKNFTVFNRLGQIVFSSSTPFTGWNGFYNGKPQSAGVYLWIASGVGYRGNSIFRKGTVLLVR